MQLRADDMSAQVLLALLSEVPDLKASDVEDVIWGCASPAGEQGYNIAHGSSRCSAGSPRCQPPPSTATAPPPFRPSGWERTPSSQASATFAWPAGSSRSAGSCLGCADDMPGTHNPRFEAAELRTAERALGGSPPWAPLG